MAKNRFSIFFLLKGLLCFPFTCIQTVITSRNNNGGISFGMYTFLLYSCSEMPAEVSQNYFAEK